MSYTKHTWVTDEVITAEKLNNIEDGVSSANDYTKLSNKPKINNVELTGNKTLEALGAVSAPSTAGTAGQVLGLDNNLDPVWMNQSGGGGSSGKLATVSTDTSWSGSDPYTSTVTVTGYTVTNKTMVSVLPSTDVIEQMAEDGITNIFITNNNGTLTATAVGAAPTAAMTLQVLCTESDASAELGNLLNIVGDGVLETLQATDLTDAINQLSSDLDDAKNAISQLQPAATQSDVGKALIVKTVDQQTGKPTSYEYGEAGGQTDIGLSVVNGQICVSYSV